MTMDSFDRARLELVERVIFYLRERDTDEHFNALDYYVIDRIELEERYVDNGQFHSPTWVSEGERR